MPLRRKSTAVIASKPSGVDQPRRLSCGIVILNPKHELLLCHVTGRDRWDLPKGGLHAGESPLQTALRETCEETGLTLAADGLLDLGRLEYRLKKSLHLFAALVPRFDASTLRCEAPSSLPTARRRLPEMDGFAWCSFDCIAELCTPKLSAVLSERLNLARVLEELTALADTSIAAPAWPGRRVRTGSAPKAMLLPAMLGNAFQPTP